MVFRGHTQCIISNISILIGLSMMAAGITLIFLWYPSDILLDITMLNDTYQILEMNKTEINQFVLNNCDQFTVEAVNDNNYTNSIKVIFECDGNSILY